jgi:hypothetical protein
MPKPGETLETILFENAIPMGKENIMKRADVLIQQFFEAAAESDERFLQSLQRLLAAARQQATPLAGKSAGVSAIRESLRTYSANRPGQSERSEIDAAVCSVGEALGEVLLANGWSKQQAASKLGVSERVCEEMLNEMMPLTGKTARSVAALLCESCHGPSAQLLADYLLNGLHFWELKHSGPAHARIAARRKGSPNDKKKP